MGKNSTSFPLGIKSMHLSSVKLLNLEILIFLRIRSRAALMFHLASSDWSSQGNSTRASDHSKNDKKQCKRMVAASQPTKH